MPPLLNEVAGHEAESWVRCAALGFKHSLLQQLEKQCLKTQQAKDEEQLEEVVITGAGSGPEGSSGYGRGRLQLPAQKMQPSSAQNMLAQHDVVERHDFAAQK